MSLVPGSRLGPYRIEGSAGAGGMGEVFRARDTRLDRTVAIKVLPAHVAGDANLRERFDREARAIASLTHPHICTLHDIGREDGVDFLVLEFVDGETLAERLQRGRLPLELVLRSAIEIADALDRAHRAGIVHRDLKPSNVMLTRSGVKLLDFGLAKLQTQQLPPGGSSAATRSLTEIGTLVGTLHYMAPEQLGGRPVDARADLFGLGAVIYEMATGRRAFDGDSQPAVIGAILHRDPPPVSALQPLASPALDHVVSRCLAKSPDDRWQSARDLMLELRALYDRPDLAGISPRQRRLRTLGVGALVVLLAAALAMAAASWQRSSAPPPPAVRAVVPPPTEARFDFAGDFGGPPVLSPDGRNIAFVASRPTTGERALWVRRLDALDAERIAGTEGASFPFWSPDSRTLGFFAEGKLKRVNVDGSGALAICNAASGRGGSWGPDGTILFTPTVRDGIYRVPAGGGEPQPLTRLEPKADSTHRWPAFLDDGRSFVYVAIPLDGARRSDTEIRLASLDGNEPTSLVRASVHAVPVGRHLLYLRDNTLLSQPLDLGRRRLSGEPVIVAEKVQHDPTIWRGIFDAVAGGPLVYRLGEDAGLTRLTWFDRDGHEAGSVGGAGLFFDLNISPDGRRVAVNRGDPADIWVYELTRGTVTRVTSDGANDSLPIWSADGERLVYTSRAADGRGRLLQARADGSDSPREVATGEVMEATDWSRDGRFLLVKVGDLRTSPGDVAMMALDQPSRLYPLVATPFAEYHARFSPDGRWVSYVSNESGRDEVYVTSVGPPPPGALDGSSARDRGRPGRWQVSTEGGLLPRWRRDGGELYYLAPDRRLMAARVDGRGTVFRVFDVRPLFQTDPKPVGWLYDVSPDGERFLVDAIGDGQDAPLVLVLNWQAAGRERR